MIGGHDFLLYDTYVGRRVSKWFGDEYQDDFEGEVKKWRLVNLEGSNVCAFHVYYDDGDDEEIFLDELVNIMLPTLANTNSCSTEPVDRLAANCTNTPEEKSPETLEPFPAARLTPFSELREEQEERRGKQASEQCTRALPVAARTIPIPGAPGYGTTLSSGPPPSVADEVICGRKRKKQETCKAAGAGVGQDVEPGIPEPVPYRFPDDTRSVQGSGSPGTEERGPEHGPGVVVLKGNAPERPQPEDNEALLREEGFVGGEPPPEVKVSRISKPREGGFLEPAPLEANFIGSVDRTGAVFGEQPEPRGKAQSVPAGERQPVRVQPGSAADRKTDREAAQGEAAPTTASNMANAPSSSGATETRCVPDTVLPKGGHDQECSSTAEPTSITAASSLAPSSPLPRSPVLPPNGAQPSWCGALVTPSGQAHALEAYQTEGAPPLQLPSQLDVRTYMRVDGFDHPPVMLEGRRVTCALRAPRSEPAADGLWRDYVMRVRSSKRIPVLDLPGFPTGSIYLLPASLAVGALLLPEAGGAVWDATLSGAFQVASGLDRASLYAVFHHPDVITLADDVSLSEAAQQSITSTDDATSVKLQRRCKTLQRLSNLVAMDVAQEVPPAVEVPSCADGASGRELDVHPDGGMLHDLNGAGQSGAEPTEPPGCPEAAWDSTAASNVLLQKVIALIEAGHLHPHHMSF
ncbi:hypothetical protein CYMTET_19771, partial [Cymbomonas tetramitiformis]